MTDRPCRRAVAADVRVGRCPSSRSRMSGYVVGLSIFLALAGCESMPQRAKEEATARWNRARAQVKASLAADHFAAGNVSAAAEELNEACRLDPTEPGLLPLRVRICLAEDRLSEAEALVEAGLRNGPPSAELEYLLGVIRQQEQRWDEALAAFKRAAELDAEEVAYVVATAQVWLQLGQPDAAQGYLESGAERFRWTNAYQAALAECHEQMGAWSAAASAWQRVIGSEAAGAALQERLAIALFRAGRYAEAAPVLDQLTSGPEASTAAALHLMLAESYLELGRDTAARTALQAVLRADRDDPRALRLLARALVVAGEDEAALATAQRVLLRQPEDVATLELVATLAWRAGNENVLVGALATLARCEPQSPVARVLRGEASSDVR